MQPLRILIVDDSAVIREIVRSALSAEGYLVWTAGSGQAALQLIAERGLPNLAVVDIQMPGMDGFAFCREVHRYSDLPIILLSVEDAEAVVVEGLQHYADDYMIKSERGPLRADELRARVTSLLERVGGPSFAAGAMTLFDDALQVDFVARRALVHGREVRLTPTEAKLLYIFMQHAGRTLPYGYLLRRLWPLQEAYEDRLHSHIYRLRQKIELEPRRPRYIQSDWGAGYHFPPARPQVNKSSQS